MAKSKSVTMEAADAFDEKLKMAAGEARKAAVAAARAWAATATRNVNGSLIGSCGRAHLNVSKPSNAFREAWARFRPDNASNRLSSKKLWLRFLEPADYLGIDQTIDAGEAACRAGMKVFQHHFPDEQFYMDSYLD